MPTPSPTATSASDGLGEYRTQRISWTPCGANECASAEVPLDYETPSGDRITLALARRPATQQPRLGTLFVNPGGPGASGKAFLPAFNAEGLGQYDIVSWDPRGVGESAPVTCLQGKDADAYLDVDASPDTPAEMDALGAAQRTFAQACLRNSGEELLAHVSTQETARDLDLLRSALGDEKLTYFGYSYGTRIAAAYAELFPDKVGRLVFDAPVDISPEQAVPQTVGFDRALDHYAQWCAATSCGLGTSSSAVVLRLRGFLDGLDSRPLKVGDRRLTESLAATGLAAQLYGGRPAWPKLTASVRDALDGKGDALLAAVDSLNARRDDGSYGSLFASFLAISCADARPQTRADALDRWDDDQEKAPFFGRYFGPDLVCVDWPARQTPLDASAIPSLPPTLVIGGTGDPATPYEYAVTMAQRLPGARLVTYESEGHGAYGGASACVNGMVRRYLVSGELPADEASCE